MNLEKYKNVFINVFEADENDLNDNFKFGVAPNWDSLAHMELIAQLEDTFDIIFETDDIIHFGSFENGIKILKKYGVDL